MKNQPPAVYIVDDEEAVCDSLRALVNSVGLPIRSFANAQEFLDFYRNDFPGCLLLDIRMPGISGLALQEELLARQATLPIIFITGHGDIPMAVAAVKKGAMDFVEKPFDDERILALVRGALELDAARRQTAERQLAASSKLAALSTREREVLDRILAGKPNRVIAEELFITVKTVEFHRARIMQKLEAGSLAELVRLCVDGSRAEPTA